jgi:hypothetical protein
MKEREDGTSNANLRNSTVDSGECADYHVRACAGMRKGGRPDEKRVCRKARWKERQKERLRE